MEKTLIVKNLTKDFNSFKAVDEVSFSVGEKEIFGLLGPNGAGKTTIIRMIATVLSASNGTAEVLGFDVKNNPEDVRKNIGVLTTDIGVYERFSGRENLEYFGRLYGLTAEKIQNRIEELAQLLKMKSFIDRRAGKYSTGMKQKLAIARSVIHDPKVIIFDEPTSGLDVLASQTVRDFMKRSREAGRCVIFSTHQMHDAEKLCDKVAIIHHGRLIANDTVGSLKFKYKASDLEDAFVKIIGEKNLEVGERKEKDTGSEGKPLSGIATKNKIAAVILVALGFAVMSLNVIGEASSAVGYVLIITAALVSSLGGRFYKN